jgi:serine/threonine protein kinase
LPQGDYWEFDMTDTPSGKKLGSYELGDLIGRGGMAAVYRAFQPSTNRYVAIKLIAANLAGSESFITRFEREARVAATLEHPNILPVYDFGREGDTLFLVMRLVEAGTLEDRIRRGSVPFVDAVRLFNQITSALSYAHQRGVVHRDLKPSNILLDERGNAYLGDFGIAKIANQTSVTAAGVFTGSPSYMAPELWRGETANVQSDIYAMGVVLFEMLTGELPFQADSPAALVYQHLNATPPSPHDLRGDLPRSVGAVINRALAKNPADRYQNIEQMGHDLNDVATGRYTDTPIAGAGGDILVDVKKRRSNTPVVVGVGALALIAIVVLVIVLSQPRSGGTGGAVTAEGTLTQAGTTEGQTPGTAVVVAPGTAVPTETATHSPTSTVTPSPTSTVTPTSTDTPTNTPSNTPTPTNTYTPSSTPTPTIDLTQTADSLTRTAFVVAATNVQATLIAFDLTRNAPTFTPTPTDTLTPTLTPTETLTPSPTDDSTATPSLTPSDTPTLTPTVFVTATPRAVAENAALNAGDTVVGTIDQSRLSNTYTINAAAGDRLLINVTATDGSLIPVVRLLDARGGFVDWNDSGGSLATIPLPFDGEYTIFVSRRNFENGATTGNYVMNVTLLEQNARPTATPIIPPFPTQTAIPSPTPLPATGPYPPSLLLTGDATPIALGTAVNGALENRGAERYAFLARKGESVKLTIRPADGSSLSAVMTLIDTTANQVIFASNRNGSGSRGEEVTEVLQNTGRYDLIVAATTTRDNSGDYQLSVNLVSPAEALAPGQQKIGSVNNFQTQKVYTIKVD